MNPTPFEIARVAIAVAGAAVLLLSVGSGNAPHARRRFLGGALLLLGLASAILWPADAVLGFRAYYNEWDTYHYYMGAKYFPELGYTGLYRAAAVADMENGYVAEFADRRVRNLETNRLENPAPFFSGDESPRHAFTPDRWREFKADVLFFRTHISPKQWPLMHADHGFNASPVWCILGVPLANLAPASIPRIAVLTSIDVVFLMVMWGFVWWAFGWRAACAAMIFWGTNHFARFGWTSASLLRHEWLLFTVAAICLVRKGRTLVGGMAITYAALLRVFPGLLVLGIVMNEAYEMRRKRTWIPSRPFQGFVIGCLVCLAIAPPLSVLATGRGWSVWNEFADNSRRHVETPLSNNMGLVALVAFDGERTLTKTQERSRQWVPEGGWKQLELVERLWVDARHETLEKRRYLRWTLAVGFLLLLALSVRNVPYWTSMVLSAGAIAFAGELTCYYFAFLLVYALVHEMSPTIPAALCLLAAVSRLVALRWTAHDEQALLNSIVVLLFVALVTTWFWRRGDTTVLTTERAGVR
jgi:hypothetical protein